MIFFVGEAPGALLRPLGVPFATVLDVPCVPRGDGGSLMGARVQCPRHDAIDGARCVDCAHLSSYEAGHLGCAVSGADPVVEWMTPAARLPLTAATAPCTDAERAAVA